MILSIREASVVSSVEPNGPSKTPPFTTTHATLRRFLTVYQELHTYCIPSVLTGLQHRLVPSTVKQPPCSTTQKSNPSAELTMPAQ